MHDDKKSGPGPRAQRSPGKSPPRIRSTDLFKGSRHVLIMHGQEEYRLQQTSTGKLILTK